MKSLVRRETSEDFKTWLRQLMGVEGIENATDEEMRRFDKKREGKTMSPGATVMHSRSPSAIWSSTWPMAAGNSSISAVGSGLRPASTSLISSIILRCISSTRLPPFVRKEQWVPYAEGSAAGRSPQMHCFPGNAAETGSCLFRRCAVAGLPAHLHT